MAAEELRFYTNPQSRGRIARWMLEEVGVDYETVSLEYGAPMRSEEYLAINPMGKVPAIVHKGTVVTECAAICAYLADAFPEAGLAPEVVSPRRGDFYRWLFFAAGPIEQAVTNKAMGFEVPKDKEGTVGFGNLDKVLGAVEERLAKGPYILGKHFSAADVYLGSQIGWGLMFGTIEPRPGFVEYHERLAQRDAAKRARELDDALVAQAQE